MAISADELEIPRQAPEMAAISHPNAADNRTTPSIFIIIKGV